MAVKIRLTRTGRHSLALYRNIRQDYNIVSIHMTNKLLFFVLSHSLRIDNSLALTNGCPDPNESFFKSYCFNR